MKLTWCADLKAESDLERMAVQFEVKKITVGQIDFSESQVNGARLNDALVNYLIEDYMTAMRHGDTFPRPVVYAGKGGWVILSGNQRCEAVRRLINEDEVGKTTRIEVYVVGTEDQFLLEIIARSGNVGHGGRSEKQERLMHAIYAVRSLGMATKDAAKIFIVTETSISMHIRAEKQRSELANRGVNTEGISTTILADLTRLDIDVGTKVGHLVAQHRPGGDRVRSLVKGLLKAQTATGRLRQVKAFECELADEAHSSRDACVSRSKTKSSGSRVPQRPRRDKTLGMFRRLVTYLETANDGSGFTSREELQISSDADCKQLTELWKRLSLRMKIIG